MFAITGASGMALARTAIKLYASIPEIELHLIISEAARVTIANEGGLNIGELEKASHFFHPADNLASPMASGSWRHDGMIVCPCSMASLAAIATGCGHNLVHRAADVTLKERRPLILAIRETPYNLIHLRNMLGVAEAGATIMPFCPAFYAPDLSLTGIMRQFAARMLDQTGIRHNLGFHWKEGDSGFQGW